MEDTLMQQLQGLCILCWDEKSPSVLSVVLNIIITPFTKTNEQSLDDTPAL